MQNLQVTHGFVRKLSKNVREAIGKDVIPHTKAMELIADALGWQVGPLMHALKQAEGKVGKAEEELRDKIVLKPVPRLHELELFTKYQFERFKEIGRMKAGLIVITGLEGSGKTVVGNALLRHLVGETGKLGVAVGQKMEYENGGKIGDGMIVPHQTAERLRFSYLREVVQTHDPEVLLFEDPVEGEEEGWVTLFNFMTAVEESKNRIVVVSATRESSAVLFRELAERLSNINPMTFEQALTGFHARTTVTIDLRIGSNGDAINPDYRAKVLFFPNKP